MPAGAGSPPAHDLQAGALGFPEWLSDHVAIDRHQDDAVGMRCNRLSDALVIIVIGTERSVDEGYIPAQRLAGLQRRISLQRARGHGLPAGDDVD